MYKLILLTVFIAIIGTTLTACSKAQLLNLTIPDRGYNIMKDISYGTLERQKLDIYMPHNASTDAPVLVFYYGGSWDSGRKEDYKFVGESLATLGYVTVIPDYRLYPEVKYPTFIEDNAAALVWVKKNLHSHGITPENLFIAGHSAGAYNAAMLATHPTILSNAGGKKEWLKGIIGLAGPYDFTPEAPKIIDTFSIVPRPEYLPTNYPQKTAPTLLIWGEEDTIVLPQNSLNFAKILQENSSEVTTKAYPKLDHVGTILPLAYRFRGKVDIRDVIQQFVTKHTAKE